MNYVGRSGERELTKAIQAHEKGVGRHAVTERERAMYQAELGASELAGALRRGRQPKLSEVSSYILKKWGPLAFTVFCAVYLAGCVGGSQEVNGDELSDDDSPEPSGGGQGLSLTPSPTERVVTPTVSGGMFGGAGASSEDTVKGVTRVDGAVKATIVGSGGFRAQVRAFLESSTAINYCQDEAEQGMELLVTEQTEPFSRVSGGDGIIHGVTTTVLEYSATEPVRVALLSEGAVREAYNHLLQERRDELDSELVRVVTGEEFDEFIRAQQTNTRFHEFIGHVCTGLLESTQLEASDKGVEELVRGVGIEEIKAEIRQGVEVDPQLDEEARQEVREYLSLDLSEVRTAGLDFAVKFSDGERTMEVKMSGLEEWVADLIAADKTFSQNEWAKASPHLIRSNYGPVLDPVGDLLIQTVGGDKLAQIKEKDDIEAFRRLLREVVKPTLPEELQTSEQLDALSWSIIKRAIISSGVDVELRVGQ